MVQLPVRLDIEAGDSCILDMEVKGTSLALPLAFKVVLHMDDSSYVEWWSRRRTDPDLLDLWTDVLNLFEEERDETQDKLEVASESFDFFRRSCSERPHLALGLEEGASAEEVENAYKALFERGQALLEKCEAGGRIFVRMTQAMTAIRQAHQSLVQS
jgi:hypothetical protein